MEQPQIVRRKKKNIWKKSSEGLCQYLLSGLGGLILGGGNFRGYALPFGACFVGAQIPNGRGICGAVGAIIGCFLRYDPAEAVESTAVILLVLMTMYLFRGTSLYPKRWFMPISTGLIALIMGGVRLLGSAEVTILPWLLKGGMCTLGTVVIRNALHGHRKSRVIFAGILVFCLEGTGSYVDLGLWSGITVACVTGEMLPGTVMGIALDLGCIGSFYNTFMLAIPSVTCKLFHIQRKMGRAVIYGSVPSAVLIAVGSAQSPQLIGIALGCLAGYILSRSPVLTPEVISSEDGTAENHTEMAATVLEALGKELPNPCQIQEGETERIFDAVGELVCRKCVCFRRCWEAGNRDTYESLVIAAPRILKKGIAGERDFPKAFRERCCCFQGLLTAVNKELEGMLYRRRYYAEQRENKRILEREYRLLAEFLRQAGKSNHREKERRFIPLVSICSAKKPKERVCGDRGVCFMAPDNNYYVILCDGMGTGQEAAGLSGYAVRLLEKLLKVGMSPDGAMALLNGNMILRGVGTFSTVDLLRLDLCTGKGYLYKWGAAPSLWREGETVHKIGTPTPPPGIGIEEEELPEKFQLSMGEGQLLVMISDGAYCDETESTVGGYRASSPRDLAALLIGTLEAEDDMTAIVVSLRGRSA